MAIRFRVEGYETVPAKESTKTKQFASFGIGKESNSVMESGKEKGNEDRETRSRAGSFVRSNNGNEDAV